MVSLECIQIKCTVNSSLVHYEIDDKIPIPDGLYIGCEVWFTVSYGKVIETSDEDTICDKYGYSIDIDLDGHNPVQYAIKRIIEKHK